MSRRDRYVPGMGRNAPHRKRCQRWNEPGQAHELTFSCYHGRAFLSRDRTRECFAHAVRTAKARHVFDVWAYVIMPEHVHLLIFPREQAYSISAVLKSIKQSVARRAIGRLRKENPAGLVHLSTGHKDSPYRFWQDGGGYDRNIRPDATLRRVIDYIHANPVRRSLVALPEEWPWSSYRDWELGEAGCIPIDKDSCIQALL